MGRREREELAIDQAVPLGRAAVPGETAPRERARPTATAGARTRPERAMTDPVPEVLRALREPEPLWAIEHRIGIDAQRRKAIERARQTLGDVPRETLAEQAERLDGIAKTFPHNRVEAAQRADQLSRLREHQREAHEQSARSWHGCTGSARSRGSSAGTSASSPNKRWPAGPNAPRTTTSRSQSSLRASTPTATSAQPGSTSTATSSSSSLRQRSSCATATTSPAGAASTTSAATRPLGHPASGSATRRSHAREQWDRAAAHLDDYRHAFGQLPGDELPDRGDYRARHAWEEVHRDAAKALEMHPERPLVERPPPQLFHDIGLSIDL